MQPAYSSKTPPSYIDGCRPYAKLECVISSHSSIVPIAAAGLKAAVNPFEVLSEYHYLKCFNSKQL